MADFRIDALQKNFISARLAAEHADGSLNLEGDPVPLPGVPSVRNPDLTAIMKAVAALKQISEVREGVSGSVMDKHLTLRDLMNEGALSINIGASRFTGNPAAALAVGSGYIDPRPVLGVPPVLTTLVASAAFTSVVLSWSMLDYANHAYVEIWRHTADVIGAATLIGTSLSNLYTDPSGTSGVTYYYWVRAIAIGGAVGPFNATAGVSATPNGSAALADLSVTADKLSQGTYPNVNLVPNPGAEDGVVAWALVEGTAQTFTADTSDKTGGSASFRITKSLASDSSGYGCRAFPVIPGETYAVKVRARGNVASAAGHYFRANEKTTAPAGGYVTQALRTSTTDFVANGPINATWTSYEYTYTVPAGIFWVSFSMYCWSASTNTSLYWDDVQVGRQITAAFLAAGSIAVGTAAIATGAINTAMIGLLQVDAARMANATITDAQIGSLNAGKITAGTLDAARIAANTITASHINSAGLTIKDAAGNVILSSGIARMRGTNMVDKTWWAPGATFQWSSNAANGAVNDFIQATKPDGTTGIVMRATAGSTVGVSETAGGGGWDGNGADSIGFPVDKTKEYMFACYFKNAAAGAVQGSSYFGITGGNVCDLNTTTPQGNPYFGSGTLAVGKWYLFVGRVFPYGSTGNASTASGIYDCETGALAAAGTNWNWANIAFCNGVRAYLYYSRTGVQYFSDPQAWVVDGTEPKLSDLLSPGALSARNQITAANVSTFIANAAILDAQIGTLNASKIVAGSITTDKIQVGQVSTLNAAATSGTSDTITSVSSFTSADHVVHASVTTTGAPVTITVEGNISFSIPAPGVKVCDMAFILQPTVDGANTARSFGFLTTPTIDDAGVVYFEWTGGFTYLIGTNPSAAAHSFGYKLQVSFGDTAGASVVTSGTLLSSIYMLVTENKV